MRKHRQDEWLADIEMNVTSRNVWLLHHSVYELQDEPLVVLICQQSPHIQQGIHLLRQDKGQGHCNGSTLATFKWRDFLHACSLALIIVCHNFYASDKRQQRKGSIAENCKRRTIWSYVLQFHTISSWLHLGNATLMQLAGDCDEIY